MKQICILGAIAGIIGLFSCKKESTTTVTETIHDTITAQQYPSGLVNADTLTAGLKVGYGSKVTGTFPASSTAADAPRMDSLYNQTYSVIRGRYLTIHPPATYGYISGYYAQIVGASAYFKVDYTQAYNLRKANNQAAFRSDLDGYFDSTIVFKLPESFNGDTFYVKYAAYDTLNRVSNTITSLVVVLPEGNDQLTDSLIGDWRYMSYKVRNVNGTYQTDDYIIDTLHMYNYGNFDCINNVLSPQESNTDYYIPYNGNSNNALLTIGKYTWTRDYVATALSLNVSASSCSNYVYNKEVQAPRNQGYGGLSYDPATRKLLLVYEYPGTSNVTLQYISYYISEVTDQYIIFYQQDSEGDDDGETYFYKYIKQ